MAVGGGERTSTRRDRDDHLHDKHSDLFVQIQKAQAKYRALSAADMMKARGENMVVINPGPERLRIGIASEFTFVDVPHCAAYRRRPAAPPAPSSPAAKRAKRALDARPSHEPPLDDAAPLDADLCDRGCATIDDALSRARAPRRKGRKPAPAREYVPPRLARVPPPADPAPGEAADANPDADGAGPPALFGDVAKSAARSGGYVLAPVMPTGRLHDPPPGCSVENAKQRMSDVWLWAVRDQLGLDRTRCGGMSAVLILPDVWNKREVRDAIDVALSTLGFRDACLHAESVAACFAHGRQAACVVSVGTRFTAVTCVDDGLPVLPSRRILPFGAADMLEVFKRSLTLAGCWPWPQNHHHHIPGEGGGGGEGGGEGVGALGSPDAALPPPPPAGVAGDSLGTDGGDGVSAAEAPGAFASMNDDASFLSPVPSGWEERDAVRRVYAASCRYPPDDASAYPEDGKLDEGDIPAGVRLRFPPSSSPSPFPPAEGKEEKGERGEKGEEGEKGGVWCEIVAGSAASSYAPMAAFLPDALGLTSHERRRRMDSVARGEACECLDPFMVEEAHAYALSRKMDVQEPAHVSAKGRGGRGGGRGRGEGEGEGEEGAPMVGIDAAVVESILACAEAKAGGPGQAADDLRRDVIGRLLRHVVCVGDPVVASLPGMAHTLERRIREVLAVAGCLPQCPPSHVAHAQAHAQYLDGVNVAAPKGGSRREEAVYRGGVLLGVLDYTQENFVQRSEWVEGGATVGDPKTLDKVNKLVLQLLWNNAY